MFGVAFGLETNGCLAHLEVEEDRTNTKPDPAPAAATGEAVVAPEKTLNVGFVRTSAEDEQARTAAVFIAKLVKMSLDLLALFVAHYHGESKAEKVGLLAKSQFEDVVAAAKSVGLQSKGLTY